ncbi:uncharacterized protein C1orf87 homolog [Discoglossus pictus]
MSQLKKFQTGDDSMPEIIVKIIGSKYVRYVVEKPNVPPAPSEEREDITSQIIESLSGVQDIENLRQSFMKVDHSGSGLLPPSEGWTTSQTAAIRLPWQKLAFRALSRLASYGTSYQLQAVCQSHGASISLQLLKAIPDHNEFFGGGKIRWKILIDLLKRTKNEDNPLPSQASGMVEKEKAKRLIHNYNQIYSLSLSPLKISEALQKFSSGHDIFLERVLLYLKEL